MQSGMLNAENYSIVLRGISQRRRQGTLEINFGESISRILFLQGKIVEFLEDEKNPAQDVYQMLIAAGLVQRKDLTVTGYKELAESLQQAGESGAPRNVVIHAIRHRILDKLYRLNLRAGGFFTFKVQMGDLERDFLPSISVGSLLLDMVALEGDAPRFAKTFPDGCIIAARPAEGIQLSEEESLLHKTLGAGVDMPTLIRRALLSRFHIQECLLALKERDLISVAAGVMPAQPAPVEQVAPAPAAPEASSEIPAPPAAEAEKKPEQGAPASDEALPQTISAEEAKEVVAAIQGTFDSIFSELAETEPVLEVTKEAAPEPAVVSPTPVAPPVTQKIEQAEIKENLPKVHRPTVRIWLNVLSSRMLYMNWIPHTVVLIFVMIALLAPFLLWSEAMFDRF